VGGVLPRISIGTWGLFDRLCLVLVCRGRYGLGGGFVESGPGAARTIKKLLFSFRNPEIEIRKSNRFRISRGKNVRVPCPNEHKDGNIFTARQQVFAPIAKINRENCYHTHGDVKPQYKIDKLLPRDKGRPGNSLLMCDDSGTAFSDASRGHDGGNS
jgi:hypothetical protein